MKSIRQSKKRGRKRRGSRPRIRRRSRNWRFRPGCVRLRWRRSMGRQSRPMSKPKLKFKKL